MKKGDYIWGLGIFAVVLMLVIPASNHVFISFTTQHPYLAGFLKFAVLATMGELLAIRIITSNWVMPKALIARSAVWGFLGIVITLVFAVFPSGISFAMANGFLPGGENKLIWAFFVATAANLWFAPVMMIFHRFTDTYLDMKYENKGKVTVSAIAKRIDWSSFYSFVILKTIPFFWIPAHTMVFLLPAEYRVILAALLSVALGGILAFAKKKKQAN